MSANSSFIRPNTPVGVSHLSKWLTDQAILVPNGWLEACIEWLFEEHGGMDACAHLTIKDWCKLIHEQWLQSDLKELACPILPPAQNTNTSRSNGYSSALKLDGELCLQVVGLFNIGDSYYSQLRLAEGDLGPNLPALEDLNDPNDVNTHTQLTQRCNMSNRMQMTNAIAKCVTLILTDGVSEIKAIEFGHSRQSVPFTELSKRLQPGVKIRLRGPLFLRNNVLILPSGALHTLATPNLEVLGGENESFNGLACNSFYEVGKLLAKKLKIALTNVDELPTWFPSINKNKTVNLDETPFATPSVASRNTDVYNDNSNQMTDNTSTNMWDDEHMDELLLAEAAQNMEYRLINKSHPTNNSASGHSMREEQVKAPTIKITNEVPDNKLMFNDPDDFIEDETDPDVLADALADLDDNNTHRQIASVKCIPLKSNSYRQNCVEPVTFHSSPNDVESYGQHSGLNQQSSLMNVSKSESQLPEANNATPQINQLSKVTSTKQSLVTCKSMKDYLLANYTSTQVSENQASAKQSIHSPLNTMNKLDGANDAQYVKQAINTNTAKVDKFQPFCYIQDMYHDLINTSRSRSTTGRIFTIRGLLISLLSSLEHHRGTKWTLSVRLTDGSATVDVDICSDLLTKWIGLSPQESESLRQLGRAAIQPKSFDSSDQFTQARQYRDQLRSALTNFQKCLSNLSGLFIIRSPLEAVDQAGVSNASVVRPLLINYRTLDQIWLHDLHRRVCH